MLPAVSNAPKKLKGYTVKGKEVISIRKLIKQDKGKCWLCKQEVPIQRATRDHVWPLSFGGPNDNYNIRLAHKECNEGRQRYINPELWVHLEVQDQCWICKNDKFLSLFVNLFFHSNGRSKCGQANCVYPPHLMEL